MTEQMTPDGHAILPAGDCACGSLLGDFDVRFCDMCGVEGCVRCHDQNLLGETGWMCAACAGEQRDLRAMLASDAPVADARIPLWTPPAACDGCLVPGGCGCRGESNAEFRMKNAECRTASEDADILHSPFNIQHSGVRP